MKTSPNKIWSRSLLRTALKLGGKCSLKKNCLNKFSSKDVKIFRWRFFYRLNDFSKEKLACFDAHCLQIFLKAWQLFNFAVLSEFFLRPALTVNLFKTPVVGQFTRKRRPPMGERSGAQLRWFTDFYEENQGSAWRCECFGSLKESESPAPFPRPPPRGSVSCNSFRPG